MTETSADPPDIGRFRSGARSKAHGFFRSSLPSRTNSASGSDPSASHAVKQENSQRSNSDNSFAAATLTAATSSSTSHDDGGITTAAASNDTTAAPTLAGSTSLSSNDATHRQDKSALPAVAYGADPPSAASTGEGTVVNGAENGEADPGASPKKRTSGDYVHEILHTFKIVILHSWINWLLVFVPVAIVMKLVPGIHPGVVFAMNCIAIVPLAGLLSHATETVARKMGDAIGALLNVTFGNAVELIIFIIALAKDEIRIVQASLLGSILANLLLILGMAFFLGGLRYREQIYNSTVTQMSACLLSLSVISLVLPTAFHASFASTALADAQSLTISRGTSVILLLVYVVYLLFQLKSHAYMYESTPQHIVDAEAIPGPAANWLDSSDSDSSSSSSSDSDGSSHSRDTMRKRMKKVLRAGRRRKSSIASVDTDMLPHMSTRTPSFGTSNVSPIHDEKDGDDAPVRSHFPHFSLGEGSEEVIEEDRPSRYLRRKKHRRHKHKKNKNRSQQDLEGETLQSVISEQPELAPERAEGEPRRVDFAISGPLGTDGGALEQTQSTTKRPFPGLRGVSVRELVTPTVFAQRIEPVSMPGVPAGPVPRVRYGIRRTNSLPDRLNQYAVRPPGAMFPAQIPLAAMNATAGVSEHKARHEEEHISRTAAIVLLLASTGLVAVCAEFLVGSIKDVVRSSPVGEIFIGLIILPIVGNAAEHVTAITVAMKNKMDLAIGVAVGSSIQIALFITPLIVILGWILDKEMTLYFTLFETVCLFVSTFIVNFLVLDGRSNYLEGALLCAAYVILSVAAFYYPSEKDASIWGA